MLENAQMFFGTPVQDYRSARDWSGPEIAYRLRVDRNSPARQLIDLLDNFVANNDVVNVTALVLGEWGGEANASSLDLVRALVCHQERLAALTAIFFGDISHQERKISGIQNTDVSPLLSAFPRLEVLRVRRPGLAIFAGRPCHSPRVNRRNRRHAAPDVARAVPLRIP
jgi:hypothetical protein